MSKHSFQEAFNDRYSPPAWALFYEVGDGTGSQKNRSADAIAMSLYPSRGLDLYGHEFKANRGDWLKELKNPDKAESIAKFCDYWFIVDTSGGEAVKQEEVPSNWGLLVWNGKTLRMCKKAEKLNPKPMNRTFLAGLLRSAHKTVEAVEEKTSSEDWVRHLDQKSYDRGYKTAEDVLTIKWEGVQKRSQEIEGAIKNFEEKSGIRISEWNFGNQAEAVRSIQRLTANHGFSGEIENSGLRLKEVAESLLLLANTVKDLSEKAKEVEKVST